MKLKFRQGLEQTFPQEAQMANKHMKRCATSLRIRGMQTKTTMKYHFTPASMTKIIHFLNENNEYWQGCGEIGTLICYWCECKVQLLWKSLAVTQKANAELP